MQVRTDLWLWLAYFLDILFCSVHCYLASQTVHRFRTDLCSASIMRGTMVTFHRFLFIWGEGSHVTGQNIVLCQRVLDPQ